MDRVGLGLRPIFSLHYGGGGRLNLVVTQCCGRNARVYRRIAAIGVVRYGVLRDQSLTVAKWLTIAASKLLSFATLRSYEKQTNALINPSRESGRPATAIGL